jgi:hypothetical protein
MSSMIECAMSLNLILALPIGCRLVAAPESTFHLEAYTVQERRRVEELYVQGLRKLANKHPPDDSSELG